jgi:uncharacterized membrane protein YfhO
LFAALLIPTLLPWFRYLFWLFQGDYYRTYSLFSIFAVITLAMIVLSRYSEGQQLNLLLLATTSLALIAILNLPFYQALVNPMLKLWATILLLAYPILLTLGQILKHQNIAALLLVGLTIVELIMFDRITVLERKIVTKDELTQRVGYNDETIEAVRDVYADDQSFFRMTKLRPSTPSDFPSLNDAMVFGYYGTTSYSSFNSVNYTNFLTVTGAIHPGSETQTRWATGLADSALLSAFACEKYVLVDDPTRFPTDPYYERIRPYGKDVLYRNRLFLPLGLTYDRYIDEATFLQLPTGEKQEALLRSVVLTDQEKARARGLSRLTVSELEDDIRNRRLSDVFAERREAALHLTSFEETRVRGTIHLENNGFFLAQTPFDRGWHAVIDDQPAPVLPLDGGLLGVEVAKGDHSLDMHYTNPLLPGAAVITLVSLLLSILALWKWPQFDFAFSFNSPPDTRLRTTLCGLSETPR